MIEGIGAAVGNACWMLGMRFEKPPIILDHENTQLESLIQAVEHRLMLDMQTLLEKKPFPYQKLFESKVFPPNMGEIL